MSITKAAREAAFTKQFSEYIRQTEAAEIRSLREAAFAWFVDNGFPSVKLEAWKYTNTAPIAAVDWKIQEDIPEVAKYEPPTADLLGNFRFTRNGFTALNFAFGKYSLIRVPAESKLDDPVEISYSAEAGSMSAPHLLVVLEPGSKATLIESYKGSPKGFTNSVVRIFVGEDAALTHYRLQNDSLDAFNYGLTEVSIGRGGFYDATSINIGSLLSRHDIEVVFSDPGGEARVDGLYLLGGRQHHDTHSVIDHRVGHCASRQNYKGILDDASRGVFNGIVYVREGAAGTDAQQSNKNLLLSNDARVDTKPQLEIFNDDVKCSHGATVGQLEDEELFYLRTRGLPEDLARNLLTYGFAEEIIEKIEIAGIKSELDAALLNRLKTGI
jgi:Fe-S cluster assembly protein SufD